MKVIPVSPLGSFVLLCVILFIAVSDLTHSVSCYATDIPVSANKTDWLIDNSPYKAEILVDSTKNELVLANGLVQRRIVLVPSATTISLKNLITGEELLRAVGPEGYVSINEKEYAIGGLVGQPVNNYFKEEWINDLQPTPGSYQLVNYQMEPIQERFPWKKQTKWLSRDLAWPPKGQHLIMHYAPPERNAVEKNREESSEKEETAETGQQRSSEKGVSSEKGILPSIEVHYEIYDGIPLFAKWLVVKYPDTSSSVSPASISSESSALHSTKDSNDSNSASQGFDQLRECRVSQFVSEELRLAEVDSQVEVNHSSERFNLHVESDYVFGGAGQDFDSSRAAHLEIDPNYPTQVNYLCKTRCLLRCYPELGPNQIVKPGNNFESFRIYELIFDSNDRERRGLSIRRLFRTLAPWTAENPLMFHKIQSDRRAINDAITQCRETGFELIIMSFGSGLNMESKDPKYSQNYRKLTDLANQSGIELGGYSLTSSREAATKADNVQNPSPQFGVGPCLGSSWGIDYLATLRSFMSETGFGVFENDGPFPGDSCSSTEHPGHQGLSDSVWNQWKAQGDLYRWCRAKGIFVNQPDNYFLSGGNKTGMGYRETNWSLPRAEQVIIERQNIFDGTWTKLNSMGWMFVPLSQYHGGGAAATIEPLAEHLDHYDARFANLLGAGVQACYRGPRLYDTDETKEVVKKWVKFYKEHREVLDGDLIHLRRASGRDWDGWLHVNPGGQELGLAFLYNPLQEELEVDIKIPLYYTGLTEQARVQFGNKATSLTAPMQLTEPQTVSLDRDRCVTLPVKIPAEGYTWLLFSK
ncbi:MAG: hypothetical protein ACRC10_10405 [Thermoguttaceae bacterium]